MDEEGELAGESGRRGKRVGAPPMTMYDSWGCFSAILWSSFEFSAGGGNEESGTVERSKVRLQSHLSTSQLPR